MSSQQTPNARVSLALLVLRIVAGAVFAMHGSQKLFEFTLAGTTEAFAGIGAPFPEITAPLVAVVEFAGGLLLIIGLLARPVAVMLAIDMAVAIALVHLQAGFWVDAGGYEFVAILGTAALAIAIAGPGRASVDAAVFRGRRLRRLAI